MRHVWFFFIVALAGWMNRQQQEVIEYLREENRVLREKLGGQHIRLNDAQKARLARPVHAWGGSCCSSLARCFRPTRF